MMHRTSPSAAGCFRQHTAGVCNLVWSNLTTLPARRPPIMLARLFRLVFSLLILISAYGAMAQDASSMTGVVTDSSGALITGAVVTLTNSSTSVSFTQKTDDKGSYRFLNVPPN